MRAVSPPSGQVTIHAAPCGARLSDLRAAASSCKKRDRQGWPVQEARATHTGLARMAAKLTARSGTPSPPRSTRSRATAKRGKRAVPKG
eukprot:163387-Chlamydomonas_euryale.AAC.1